MKGFNETTKESLASMHKSLGDKDGDGMPNAVDCEPSNPNKQGALAWVKSKIQKRPYEEVRAEQEVRSVARHDRRVRREGRRTEYAEARAKTQTVRGQAQRSNISLQHEKLKLQTAKEKARPPMKPMAQMPSMFGNSSPFGMSSPIASMPTAAPKTAPKKRKKRTTKRRKKGKK